MIVVPVDFSEKTKQEYKDRRLQTEETVDFSKVIKMNAERDRRLQEDRRKANEGVKASYKLNGGVK